MKFPLFKINKTGLQTSFQDSGRIGFQKYGVVQGGAMDHLSLNLGNILVGNEPNEACMEVCMIGPEMECLSPTTIAICGGDLSPTLNGKKLPMWRTVRVQKGDLICFGKLKSGLRAYIAVKGGFYVPTVMGSKSYYDKAKIGYPIQKDTIIFGSQQHHAKDRMIGLSPNEIPQYLSSNVIRFIVGPHEEYFTRDGLQTFLETSYEVTSKSDRMGIRLHGEKGITHTNGADIISDAVGFGGIQVPSNGQPIVMMADRQTTGGYSRIGTVISVDLPKLAQMKPGDTIRFQGISVEEAHLLIRKRSKYLHRLQHIIK